MSVTFTNRFHTGNIVTISTAPFALWDTDGQRVSVFAGETGTVIEVLAGMAPGYLVRMHKDQMEIAFPENALVPR